MRRSNEIKVRLQIAFLVNKPVRNVCAFIAHMRLRTGSFCETISSIRP